MKNIFRNIAIISLIAMFFSCVNSVKEVNDFLADKNKPIGESFNVNHVYKDSGRIVFRMITPLLYDFSNRKEHPYQEFPKGIKLVTIGVEGDSTTVTGNYAISYSKTAISEIVGNVEVLNHKDKSKLETSQLYWDQKTNFFFTEEKFRLTLEQDTINGIGFESRQDLQGWVLKHVTGDVYLKNEE